MDFFENFDESIKKVNGSTFRDSLMNFGIIGSVDNNSPEEVIAHTNAYFEEPPKFYFTPGLKKL